MPHSPVALLHLESLNWLTPPLFFGKITCQEKPKKCNFWKWFSFQIEPTLSTLIKGANQSALYNNFNRKLKIIMQRPDSTFIDLFVLLYSCPSHTQLGGTHNYESCFSPKHDIWGIVKELEHICQTFDMDFLLYCHFTLWL